MKSESFLTCIDSNTTDHVQGQKGGKDIVKIVHVTSVVQPFKYYEATRIIFVHKKTKNNDFIQQSFTRVPWHNI